MGAGDESDFVLGYWIRAKRQVKYGKLEFLPFFQIENFPLCFIKLDNI